MNNKIKRNEKWLNIETGKYICPYCGKEYSKMGICTHIWKTHTDEGKEFNPNRGYKKGTRTAWNKGLTKDNDERVLKYSNSQKGRNPYGSFSKEWQQENYELFIQFSTKGGLSSAKKQIRRSKNEIYFSTLCKQKWVNTFTNIPLFNGWDADIIIEEFRIAVLWNGPWHYNENIRKGHSLDQVKSRDKIKEKLIRKNGYIPYIIKDLGSYDTLFVEQEFQKFCIFINNIKEYGLTN